MSMTVIKRSGEEVVLDLSKIVAAITKAFEEILPKIQEAAMKITESMTALIDAMCTCTARIADSVQQTACSVAHGLLHLLMHFYCRARNFVSRVIPYDPRSVVYYAATVCIIVRTLTLEYIEHTCVSRRRNLFRRQDRGSKDSVSDNDNLILVLA